LLPLFFHFAEMKRQFYASCFAMLFSIFDAKERFDTVTAG